MPMALSIIAPTTMPRVECMEGTTTSALTTLSNRSWNLKMTQLCSMQLCHFCLICQGLSWFLGWCRIEMGVTYICYRRLHCGYSRMLQAQDRIQIYQSHCIAVLVLLLPRIEDVCLYILSCYILQFGFRGVTCFLGWILSLLHHLHIVPTFYCSTRSAIP